MIEQALTNLSKVIGVSGVAFIGPTESYSKITSAFLDLELFKVAAQLFDQVSTTIDVLDLNASLESWMVNSDVGGFWFRAIENWTLILISAPSAKPVLITVALNTAHTQLKRALSALGYISVPAAMITTGNQPALSFSQTSGPSPSGRGVTSHHSAAPQHSPFSSSPQITTTGGFSALIRPSPEGPWGASTPPHTTEATRLLGLPPLRRILRVMEDDLGEAALPTLREIFAVMGTTPQVIRFAQLQQLFNEISSRLKTLETKNNLYKLINEIIQT